MAKQASFIKIEGTIQDLTFYKGADGTHYVRSKGGVSAEKIQNDPSFQRTRENGKEFGNVATSGKLLRRAIQNLTFDVKDRTRISRLMRTLTQVKNRDTTSIRGERRVHIGIATAEGKEVFNFFEFNINARLDSVLKSSYDLDTTAGTFEIPDFVPMQNLGIPQGATHYRISLAKLRFNFATGDSELEISHTPVGEIDLNTFPVTLALSGTPTGTGQDYYFLKVGFFQEINTELYTLHNGSHNSLCLISIE